jgi:hypothetical protein
VSGSSLAAQREIGPKETDLLDAAGLDRHAGHWAREGDPMSSFLRSAFAVIVTLTTAMVAFTSPASATYPGNNGLIVFGADTGDGYELYTVRPNGEDLVQITDLQDGEALTPTGRPTGPESCSSWVMRWVRPPARSS